MQDASHLLVNGQKILVLRRSTRYGTQLKLRKSGYDGLLLADESRHLEETPTDLDRILKGIPTYC